ncbi:complement C1q tumor necrosis factor-related protein 5-like [Ruditapes philippinarum]|uniref:complement C1q tumor necrosis factor-related protein 5-like n=1 Tax=Ruditapes philippinarum TaxID=129788 RepID=UPI00295AB114|nr:complement C1q tumor necrosis factor-related protein 5-like [Ruditapes philippinarum]
MVNEIKKTEDKVISTLGDIKQTVTGFTNMFEDMKGNITDEMLKRGDAIQRREEKLEQPSIAFYAHHLKDLALDTTNEILIFEKTITNEGTGYDTSTGLFTAPVGGLYQFVVHTCAYKGKYSYLGLVMEGNVIAADANYGDTNYGCNTFGAIVRVKSGEKVWVKSTSSGSVHQLHQNTHRMNTFSGVLVNY